MKNNEKLLLISFFGGGIVQTEPSTHCSILELLSQIQSGTWREKIEEIRQLPDEEGQKYLKKRLPYFTVSGTFAQRNAAGLISHSGLIQIDLDHLPNVQAARLEVEKDPHTFACFLSPTGTGLKVIFRIEPKKETHKISYSGIESYFLEKYGLTTDPAVKDVSRACFVSFDPEAYINENSQKFLTDTNRFDKPNPAPNQPRYTLPPDLYDSCFEGNVKGVSRKHFLAYDTGQRNFFLFHLACSLKRYGMPEEEARKQTTACYTCSDFTEIEINTTVRSAYSTNPEEFGKYEWKVSGKKEPMPEIEKPKPDAENKPTITRIKYYLSQKYDFQLNTVKNKILVRQKREREFTEFN